MKNSININSITLINFKGVKSKTIEFKDTTNIFGANATGKTTIFDAFVWGLFGKDSSDRKDFEIKTLDQNGNTTKEVEVEVKIVLTVNGEQVSIQKILKENWVKKRGSEFREFSGNVTEFYWNGVPMQLKEFQLKISSILEESVFKLITNPLAFNALNWKERRNILISMAPTSPEELASGNAAFEKLLNDAKSYKDLVEYGKMIAASITKAKQDLKDIPTRIDEVNRSKPEALDFESLRLEVLKKEKELSSIDEKIQDKSKAFDSQLEAINSKKREANLIKNDIEIIEDMARKQVLKSVTPDTSVLDNLIYKYDTSKDKLRSDENALQSLQSKASTIVVDIENTDNEIIELRAKWNVENAKELTFDDNDFHCPTCKREFEAGNVEEKKSQMLLEFKKTNSKALSDINTKGGSLAKQKEAFEKEWEQLKTRIANGESHIKSSKQEVEKLANDLEIEKSKVSTTNSGVDQESIYNQLLSNNPAYQSKKVELANLQASISEAPAVDNSELISQRKLIIDEIDNIKGQLNIENQIKSVDSRITQLQEEEKALSKRIASVEKQQFIIESFNKLCIETLERKINDRFKLVQFKMFNTLINGGTEECCDALINGVPFSDANTASKINAGLDIINTLCNFYEITAPIFIDNRESIIDIVDTESQIINLVVSESDKSLRVA